ncbi:CPBP family intramembrane glutamic endopeptidase [Nonomuraea sp. NPDC050556]|uniref:CPBP family intramembrane glutamic endopeptidase n=1 Tax=Nonomuraea sp. NPDC050556 TaxID=3364369 RepID=UPI003791C146
MTDNPLFTLARSGKRQTHPALAVLIVIAALLFGELIGGGLGSLVPMPEGPAWALLFQLVFGFAPVAFLMWVWVRGFEGRGWRTFGFTGERAGLRASRGFLTGLLSFSVVVGILAVLGFTLREEVPQGLAAVGPALLVLVGWIVQGSTEEIVTRGYLLPVTGARWGAPAGVAVSAGLFAVLHLLNPGITVLSVVNLVLVGVLLALYALYEGALWGACLWHAAWNWAQGSVFGLEVSGLKTGMLAVLDLKEDGPDVVTGGLFGPEGGLATTLTLSLGIAVIFLAARRKGSWGRG